MTEAVPVSPPTVASQVYCPAWDGRSGLMVSTYPPITPHVHNHVRAWLCHHGAVDPSLSNESKADYKGDLDGLILGT